MRNLLAAVVLMALAACGSQGGGQAPQQGASATPAPQSGADSMASQDRATGQLAKADIPDPQPRPIMQAQVVLDRAGFGPGVIDGKMGISTTNALKGFQEAHGLPVTGELDTATQQALAPWKNIPATRVVRIPQEWGTTNYVKIPKDEDDKAKLQSLGYQSLDERLSERFHTTAAVLDQLNPNGRPAGMTGAAAMA
jgi:peptidoglycan hydrolase-like protein with peptidoglycan-binding domain